MSDIIHRLPGEHPADLATFALARMDAGARVALVTIVDFVGSSSRSLGAHMAVSEDGAYMGSVSSGCFDANVVAFAMRAIETGRAARVKFGEGSPYVDVKLPCGGGVDLLITPQPSRDAIGAAVEALKARRACGAVIGEGAGAFAFDDRPDLATGWRGDAFVNRYDPKLRVVAVGRGDELISMARVACAAGFDVEALGPDKLDLAVCEESGAAVRHLGAIDADPGVAADPWTAIVLLFHDHEWEPTILNAALETDAFYVGALGSRRTHEARLETLSAMGADEAARARVRGPIGLVPSMRNTSMLAISTLAEIISTFNAERGR
ncbi:MAG: XdhC family protein [Pseudomonadota bacterium]